MALEKSNYDRGEVIKIVSSVVSKMEQDKNGSPQRFYEEIKGLEDILHNLRMDIAATGSGQINSENIPSASDELDAVLGATEDASGSIMDACDEISEAAAGIEGEASEKIMNAVTNIYEACSFQDITGQRISKVIKTLHEIEEKVGKLNALFGTEHVGKIEDTRTEDEKLLNGPQLPGDGVSQDDIDRLLAEFD